MVSALPPGEHEYINPIINISAKVKQFDIIFIWKKKKIGVACCSLTIYYFKYDDPEKERLKMIEVQYSDHSESEIEDTTQYSQNSKLLR